MINYKEHLKNANEEVNKRICTYGASQPGWEKEGLNVEKSKFEIVYCDKIY